MNARIFELIQHQNGFCGLVWTEEDKKEFAEFILQQCLEKIYSVTIDNPTDDWDQGYASGLIQAAETIKESFGVKE